MFPTGYCVKSGLGKTLVHSMVLCTKVDTLCQRYFFISSLPSWKWCINTWKPINEPTLVVVDYISLKLNLNTLSQEFLLILMLVVWAFLLIKRIRKSRSDTEKWVSQWGAPAWNRSWTWRGQAFEWLYSLRFSVKKSSIQERRSPHSTGRGFFSS